MMIGFFLWAIWRCKTNDRRCIRNGQIPTIIQTQVQEKKEQDDTGVDASATTGSGKELPELTYIELPIASPSTNAADCQSISSRREFVFHIPLPSQV